MRFLDSIVAAAPLYAVLVTAQTSLQEQIWGTVMFTLNGDRTPMILPNPVLTPLGAQQLYAAGSAFRDRYVNPVSTSTEPNTGIYGISAYELDNEQVAILTYSDQYFVASAQAFMQGLYPPVESSLNYTFINVESELANGSNVAFPLNGYQYPQLYTASEADLNSIYVAGDLNCPMYTSSRSDYFTSNEYQQLDQSTQSFYAGFQSDVLDGVFSNASVGYFDAYYIWDYLNYGVIHNDTIARAVSSEQLAYARTLADQWIFAMNGNTTASGSTEGDHIRAIAGRTLAYEIAQALYTNINTQGVDNKMTLMFGSYEPIVAFASLAGLATEQTSQFFGQPEYGSTMVFELYSLEANETSTYPDPEDLLVRFLFQNGTGSSLTEFPLFGNDPSEVALSVDEFMSGLEEFMILNIGQWCEICDSPSVFCPAYVTDGSGSTSPTGSDTNSQSDSNVMKPAIAGVIGAIIALVLVAVVVALGMLLGGLRVYRQSTKRRSELGGFKGGEKLASDQDLTVTKSGVGATVVKHERIGSWELGQGTPTIAETTQATSSKAPQRSSFEEDELHVSPFADAVKADDKV